VRKVSRLSQIKKLNKTKLHTLEADTASHGNVHWSVHRPTNNLFTGRGELLLRIQKALHCDQTSSRSKQKRFVITGLGGQGKSEICLQVANQMQEEYVSLVPSILSGLSQLIIIGSGGYSGSMSGKTLLLRATSSLLQRCLGGQSRAFLMLFKFLQLLSKGGSLFLTTPTIRILTTRPTFHPEHTAPSL
jgi:hypothetical protein